MPDKSVASSRRVASELPMALGLAGMVIFFVISGFVLYANMSTMNENATRVTNTHNVIIGLSGMLSDVKDAETGQRGYVITGKESYLEPYTNAVTSLDERLKATEEGLQEFPESREKVPALRAHVVSKMKELAQTIELRRARGFEAALNVVLSDRGKHDMDEIRRIIGEITADQQRERQKRLAEMDQAYAVSITSGLAICALGVFLSFAVSFLLQKAAAVQRREQWLQTGLMGLSNAMSGDQTVERLGDNIVRYLAEYLGAHAGVFFAKHGETYQRVAVYGVPDDENTPKQFHAADGLLGQAARDGRTFVIHDVPDGYLRVGSALGQGKPRSLVVTPASIEHTVSAVMEFGFVHNMEAQALQLLDQVSEPIAVALRSANYRENLQNLLHETQSQAEELQAQGEELRVSNEELEEQSRTLQEAQTRLELQQAELEQTNAQLEEQTQSLEVQRDDLEGAQKALKLRSQELEQASQYKSDFLANMSHELRTPLNSSLILAKLLADNPDGNLSDEQVRHAETIQSAGNDLLNLINDILDLSKIEAGHMEIMPESVLISKLVSDISRYFEPIASQKGLRFVTTIDANCPRDISTDAKRFEQILKNLLSNAMKFTEQGEVKLTVTAEADKRISFAVSDTGIGISEAQQRIIFDAFKQADGTTNRKYGGTGLGLSISKELARLLGGEITLESTPAVGSTFTVTVPEVFEGVATAVNQTPLQQDTPTSRPANIRIDRSIESQTHSDMASSTSAIEDDRNALTNAQRILMVVEDDESFAKILFDLAHEQNFQCLIANTADEAIKIAKAYLPHAIILDIGLPDNSGLSVLDRLKQDARTRHIPVHVVSGQDYTETALSLGAVGYMLKPVKRDDLIKAFKQFDERLIKKGRTILVVEDDKVQRESIEKLLRSQDVETVGVGTAAECLALLSEKTFDCMVLDLSLPDASGYSLLETLSKEETYAFPPVVVYTGRDLTIDQEQTLRRYSRSIIIKGAKSPERLLDEVTLFLHQVVGELPQEQQKMLRKARNRDAVLEGRRILIVEDDVRNVYSLSNILEPRGAVVQIARNGKEALAVLEASKQDVDARIDLVLMDVMMPEMDGITATIKIRMDEAWKKLPIIMLTAKAMQDDQERCLSAGANDYMAKPLDVEKLLSLVRVWMPR
jgi:signal transduction histidine kinase/CheY-like chemotaxis protein/CHASE3 domain sensor protein